MVCAGWKGGLQYDRRVRETMSAGQVEELYRQHGGLVYRRCLALLRDPDEARSAVQEVFLRIMGRLAHEEAVGNIRSYLFRAATNHCLNLLRDRRKLADCLDCDHVAGARRDDPHQQMAWRDRLEACLAGLSDRDRLAVHLYWGEGLTQDEVAEVLGLNRVTVVHLLARLRERLRLKDTLGGDGT